METKFIVTISVICGVFCLLFLLNYIFKSVRNKLELHLQKRFDKEEIIWATTRANFFGLFLISKINKVSDNVAFSFSDHWPVLLEMAILFFTMYWVTRGQVDKNY